MSGFPLKEGPAGSALELGLWDAKGPGLSGLENKVIRDWGA